MDMDMASVGSTACASSSSSDRPLVTIEPSSLCPWELTSKVFVFGPESSLLPPQSTLSSLKSSLNAVKSELSHLDQSSWHAHTHRVNPAHLIRGEVLRRCNNNAELVTQAWLKFRELLKFHQSFPYNGLKRIRDKQGKLIRVGHFNTVHLCEAPGAFVCALNHFLKDDKANEQVNWNWRANSLNPHLESLGCGQLVNDDRLLQHTPRNWCFGRHNSGDVIDPDNRASIIEELKQTFEKVHLVTADGSIDCQGEPGEQEMIVHALHEAEVLIALNVLAEGGHFVLKMFTFFEMCTIRLLGLLRQSFERVWVVKPVNSKWSNSEVYVVAMDYKGIPEVFRPHLSKSKDVFKSDDFPIVEETSFMKEIVAGARKFTQWQIEAIQSNLKAWHDVKYKERMLAVQEDVSKIFFNHNKVTGLKLKKRVVKDKMAFRKAPNVDLKRRPRLEKVSDNSKQESSLKRTDSWLSRLQEEVLDTFSENRYACKISRAQLEIKNEDRAVWDEQFVVTTGLPYDRVLNSKFCTMHVINLYNEVFDLRAKVTTRFEVPTVIVKGRCESDRIGIKDFSFDAISRLPFTKFDRNIAIFDHIEKILPQLSNGDDIVIRNCSFLTRFDVCFLIIILQAFTLVETDRNELKLIGFQQERVERVMTRVKEARILSNQTFQVESATSYNLTVHSILPLQSLYHRDLNRILVQFNLFALVNGANYLCGEERGQLRKRKQGKEEGNHEETLAMPKRDFDQNETMPVVLW